MTTERTEHINDGTSARLNLSLDRIRICRARASLRYIIVAVEDSRLIGALQMVVTMQQMASVCWPGRGARPLWPAEKAVQEHCWIISSSHAREK
jgi:hypothetical protein